MDDTLERLLVCAGDEWTPLEVALTAVRLLAVAEPPRMNIYACDEAGCDAVFSSPFEVAAHEIGHRAR